MEGKCVQCSCLKEELAQSRLRFFRVSLCLFALSFVSLHQDHSRSPWICAVQIVDRSIFSKNTHFPGDL